MVVDDVRPVDPGVDDRISSQRLDRRLDEKRHEAEADVVFVLEGVLVLAAQGADSGEIGLVEGRQDRGGVLGRDQPLGDALADAAQPLACLAWAGWLFGFPGLHRPRGWRNEGLGRRFLGRGRRWGFLRLLTGAVVFLDKRRNVFLGHAAARAGPCKPGNIDALFLCQAAC